MRGSDQVRIITLNQNLAHLSILLSPLSISFMLCIQPDLRLGDRIAMAQDNLRLQSIAHSAITLQKLSIRTIYVNFC